MSIEIESRRLKKNELRDVLLEMFACTAEWSDKHMDQNRKISGVICTRKDLRRIPFFRNPSVESRKALEEDFERFLEKEGVSVLTGGSSFLLVDVMLGRSSGRDRSYFVSDGKQVEAIAERYAKDNGWFVLAVSHFSEKTADNSAMVEHVHVLYRFPFGVSDIPPFEEFLSEQYEED